MSEKRIHLTESSARRIADAVQRVERSGRDVAAPMFRQVSDDGDPVRLCKTTASWSKNTTQSLSVWESGTTPNETQTTGASLTATNKFATIASGKFVVVARGANGVWYLIAAEC